MTNIRSRNYCFTWNNPTPGDLAHIRNILSHEHALYGVFGMEESPTTGTPHAQGYIQFHNKKSFAQVKKALPPAHIEVAKGTPKQNQEYCTKDGNSEEFGTPPKGAGSRSDLEACVDLLKSGATMQQLAEECPCQVVKFGRGLRDLKLLLAKPYTHDNVRGTWVWGPPGTGKSHTAREQFPDAFIKPQNKWWDGYANEETIILDDLDTATLGHYLKIWTDKYATTGETKGGTINLQYKRFIITSNYTPHQLWPEDPVMCEAIKRRCVMFHKATRENSHIIE
ncbi:MAG: putative viral replication protein [Cressdnaviricota sp.]|nr:MAG: putative viral replication protein [Cressdnaviricota sp.]